MNRTVAASGLIALVATGCADIEGIPSDERLVTDGGSPGSAFDATRGPMWDGTVPANGEDGSLVSGKDGSLADGEGGQDATPDGGGPDCSAPFNADWAAWPMPNSPQDVEGGSPNLAHYTDNRDGTVTDDVTGLMWEASPIAGLFPWTGAKDQCVQQNVAGHVDWRLPSYIELVSLVEYKPTSPAIDSTYFPGTPADAFWSSTPLINLAFPSRAYFVEFGSGSGSYDYETSMHYARCVRNGASP
jgi:hypothetical protein